MKLHHLASTEIESLDRSTANATKKCKDISGRADRFQGTQSINSVGHMSSKTVTKKPIRKTQKESL